MQIYSEEVAFLIVVITIVFCCIPLFLFVYVSLYNQRKKKHIEEKTVLKQAFTNELLKSQVEVQEQTLKTVSYDLHDNIGQLLGLTSITLSSINLDNPVKAAEKLAAVEELTQRTVNAVRALSKVLHGDELLSRGLTEAIVFELEWLKTSDVYKINFQNQASHLPPHPECEIILFRLFQEILNNTIKHACASEITIMLNYADKRLTLAFEDDGQGFEMAETTRRNKGMGLHNIHKRVEMIGGNVIINSRPGNGTQIVISVPY